MTNKDIHEDMRKELEAKHAGYVLITCDHPKEDGTMDVKMTYGGEPALAEYLVNGAMDYFYDEPDEEKTLSC